MSDKHKHEYERLNDQTIFCTGCGEMKSAPPKHSCAGGCYHYWTPTYPTYPTYFYSTNSSASGIQSTLTF